MHGRTPPAKIPCICDQPRVQRRGQRSIHVNTHVLEPGQQHSGCGFSSDINEVHRPKAWISSMMIHHHTGITECLDKRRVSPGAGYRSAIDDHHGVDTRRLLRSTHLGGTWNAEQAGRKGFSLPDHAHRSDTTLLKRPHNRANTTHCVCIWVHMPYYSNRCRSIYQRCRLLKCLRVDACCIPGFRHSYVPTLR